MNKQESDARRLVLFAGRLLGWLALLWLACVGLAAVIAELLL